MLRVGEERASQVVGKNCSLKLVREQPLYSKGTWVPACNMRCVLRMVGAASALKCIVRRSTCCRERMVWRSATWCAPCSALLCTNRQGRDCEDHEEEAQEGRQGRQAPDQDREDRELLQLLLTTRGAQRQGGRGDMAAGACSLHPSRRACNGTASTRSADIGSRNSGSQRHVWGDQGAAQDVSVGKVRDAWNACFILHSGYRLSPAGMLEAATCFSLASLCCAGAW